MIGTKIGAAWKRRHDWLNEVYGFNLLLFRLGIGEEDNQLHVVNSEISICLKYGES